MTYLITCSSSKKNPTLTQCGNIDNLFGDEVLGEYRLELIEQSRINLDWSKTLPAYELYSGPMSKIYSKVSHPNWLKPCVEIKILSALFGWIRHTDRIPYYDLKIDEKKGRMLKPAYIFWRDENVLNRFCNSNDIDLLSNTYKKAFKKDKIIIATRPKGFSYKDRGDRVGYWLENELNNITCN